jgi:hypothetical protein
MVTICPTKFNIQNFYLLPAECVLCLMYGSQEKRRLLAYIMLTGWFLGTFAKVRKAAISFVIRLSVSPYGTTRPPLDGFL